MNLDTLKARLATEEGDRLAAYLDSEGFLTVGIGHNCVAKPVIGITKVGDRITPALEQALFEADVLEACEELDAHLPWWKSLDDARQNVMVDLCFNMGIETLLTFHNTLLDIREGQYEAAADGMRHSKWHDQVGDRAPWLENAMRTGAYA